MPSGLIVTDGDSLTAGSGVTPWPTVCAAALAYGAGVTWTNVAVGGATTSSRLVAAPTAVDALYGTVPGPTNLYVCWVGTNDIAEGGSPPIHVYNRIRRLCGERKTKGFRVIVANMISRGYGGAMSAADIESFRTALNTLISANYTAFADALVDLGANAAFGPNGYLNTVYYQVDLVHLNATGNNLASSLLQTAIASLVT